jgi:hypothetical protein
VSESQQGCAPGVGDAGGRVAGVRAAVGRLFALSGLLASGAKHWADALAAAFVSIVPFGAYYRLWLPGPRAQYLWGDTSGLYWPDLVYLYHALTQFQLPLWNPFERGGVSMLSEPEAGVLYPLNWVLVAAGVAGGGMPFVMIEIKACLHLAIGGLALFFWLRRRGLHAGAAAIGAVIYELGPYTTGNAFFALIWPQAWLPVVMLAIDWLLDGSGPLAGLAVAAASYLLVVAGSPPTAFYCALVVVPYACVRAVQVARRDGAGTTFAKARGPMLLATGLALVSCYPSVRGTFEAMRFSERAERTFGYVAETPLPSAEWRGLLLRDGSHVFVYVGLPVAVLAAIGFARWHNRAEAKMFATLAVFGFLLMLGAETPLLKLLYDSAPPFRLFRICNRYVFLVQVAVAVLAAQGFAALSELRDPGRRLAWARKLAAPIGAMAAVLVVALPRLRAPNLHDEVRSMVVAGAITLVLVVAAAARPRLAPWLAAPMALVVAVDLGAATQRAGVLHEGRFDPRSSVVPDEWVRRMQNQVGDNRVFAEFGLSWRAGSRLGLRDLRGYLEPLTMQRVLDVYAQIGKAPQLLALFNVRWLLHSAHATLGKTHNFVKSADHVPGIEHREGAVFEVDDPAPYAYWVQGARVQPTVAAALAHLGDLDRRGELVLAEEDVGPVAPDRRVEHAPRQAATLEERSLSSLRFTVDAPAAGYVVVNEAWFPGWRATLDGNDAPLLRGNVIMQALDVPAGHHVIQLRFRPGYVLYPLEAALAAWLAALGWVFWPAIRRRSVPLAHPVTPRLSE